MTAKHTPAEPLPYSAERFAVKSFWRGRAYTVARTNEPRFTPEGREQNAAYLVHAANAYPKLVEALNALFKECLMTHKHWGEGCNQKEADAAIASATAILRELGEVTL